MRRDDRELERRLHEVELPDEAGAEQRAWELIREAHAERVPVRPSRSTQRWALGGAAGLIALAIGLSPAGAKVGDLVSDVTGIGEENAKPELRSLPAAGELLVESPQGPWVVGEDGSKRLLGDYGDATWSPHGLFVAVADGDQLLAVEPDGRVRWVHPTPGRVADPRWSPSAGLDTRISYRAGDDLRVVAGDGTDDRLIARDVAPVAPAWRPIGDQKVVPGTEPHILTYVDDEKRIHTVDVDTGESIKPRPEDLELLSAPPGGGSANIANSPDGSQMATLVHSHRGGSVISGLNRGQDRLVIQRDGGGGKRVLFSAPTRLTGPTWSPDGRWLLVGLPSSDQWVFIQAEPAHRGKPRGRVVAFDRISKQFDPGGSGAGAFPRVSGWVLPER
jgi:hypothetical protein